MWLDNLKEIKREKNMSVKQLAEKANLPEKTITRILSGRTANPYIDTLDRLATALDCTIGDILAGTRAVVGDVSLSDLQSNIDTLTLERDTAIAERDILLADNAILKDKNTALTAEVDLLKMQIMYKDKIIATHEYYNKLKSNGSSD
jgi:transcriptional regulator with XRE-family HTH domain